MQEVGDEFHMQRLTVHASVALVDRALSTLAVSKDQLQLCAAVRSCVLCLEEGYSGGAWQIYLQHRADAEDRRRACS